MTSVPGSRQTKIDAGAAIGEGARTYGRHAFVVVGASVTVQIVALVATLFAMNGSGILAGLLTFLIPTMAGLLLTGVLTMVLLDVRTHGSTPPISDLISRALPRVPGLFLLAWLTGLVISVGFLLFIVPGFILLLRLALAPSLMVVSRLGAMDALRASWDATGSAKSATFVLLLFQVVCTVGVIYLSIELAGGAFGAEENVIIAEALVTALVVPLPTLAFAELALRLNGIYGDPATGLSAPITFDGPAHRVHVPQGVTAATHASPAFPAPPAGQRPAGPSAPEHLHRPPPPATAPLPPRELGPRTDRTHSVPPPGSE